MTPDSWMPAAAPKGLRRRWFCADGCSLAIDTPTQHGDGRIDALLDAALLGQSEGVLGYLAALCGADRDWRPVAANEAVAFGYTVVDQRTGQRAGIAMSDELRSTFESRLESVADPVHVAPHRVAAQLVLDSVSLSRADSEQLALGAMLLLPAGFAQGWAVRLAVPGNEELCLAARLDPATGQVLPKAPVAARTTGRSVDRVSAEAGGSYRYDVVLKRSVDLPVADWMQRGSAAAGIDAGDVSAADVLIRRCPVEPMLASIDTTTVVADDVASEATNDATGDNGVYSPGDISEPLVWSGSLQRVGLGWGVLIDRGEPE